MFRRSSTRGRDPVSFTRRAPAAVTAAPPRPARSVSATRTWWAASAEGRALARVLWYFLLTRLLLAIVAAVAIRTLPAGVPPRS